MEAPKPTDTSGTIPQERISLLGGSGSLKVELPEIDSFAVLADQMTQVYLASFDELKQLYLAAVDSPNASNGVLFMIGKRLIIEDPEATIEFLTINDRPEDHFHRFRVESAFSEWARRDLSAAVDAAMLRDPKGDLTRGIVFDLDATQSERLYQMLLERGLDKENPDEFSDIFYALSHKNPELTTKRAWDFHLKNTFIEGQEDHNQEGDYKIQDGVEQWYHKDPGGALSWLLTQKDSSTRTKALNALAHTALRENGPKGLEWISEHIDEEHLPDVFNNFHRRTKDVEGVIAWADTNIESTSVHQEVLTHILRGLAQSNHPEAMVSVLSHFDRDFNDHYIITHIRQAGKKWAEQDLEGYQAWIDSVENPHFRSAAENGLISHWMVEDPSRVLEYLKDAEGSGEMPRFTDYHETDLFGGFMQDLIEAQGKADPAELIDSFPDTWADQVRFHYASAVSDMGEPEKAVNFLQTQPEGTERNRALQVSIGKWAAKAPSEAAEWVNTLSEGQEKELAARNLANTWARFDVEGAHAWVEDLPPSTSRDRAAEQVIDAAWLHHPEHALSLAQSMTDQDLRERFVMQTITNLARRNPDLATEHAENASLPAGLRAQALHAIEQERAMRARLEGR